MNGDIMAEDIKAFRKAYRKIIEEDFPSRMEIAFIQPQQPPYEKRQTLFYEKVKWGIRNPETNKIKEEGLRYGENPGQKAALYRLVNGNLVLGDVETIKPGRWLVSDAELLQSGKHPGKINITDADSALNILRYFPDKPTVTIIKHNNPCGVARRDKILKAYHEANMADRLAAFGGVIALNRAVNLETAKSIAENYSEVVVAPEFEEEVMGVFGKKKNLRIMRIKNMEKLHEWDGEMYPEFKTLIDGGQIVQWPYVPKSRSKKNLTVVTNREPTEKEYNDLIFGWLVEAGVTSNSVLYVRNDTTLGIGAGEQDRVGAAKIGASKAFEKYADRIAWETKRTPYNLLPPGEQKKIMEGEKVKKVLENSCMISDAFFPFRDGVDVGIGYGVKAVIQPGGSVKDEEVIAACNEANVAMVFTGQRSFKH